jgi:chromosome segregation ATPase
LLSSVGLIPVFSLSSLVWLLGQRDKYRAEIQERTQLVARNSELRSMIDAENAKLEAAVQAHQAACHPLQYEIQQNNSRVQQIGPVELELFKSCESESLKSQLSTITFQLESNARKRGEASDRLERAKANRGGHDYQRFPDTRKTIDDRITRAQSDLEALSEANGRLLEQRTAIEQAMREW